MPRGGGRAPKKNYKGRSRHFTDAETLNQQMEKEERERQWRKQRGDVDEDEEEKKPEASGADRGLPPSDSESGSEESESDEEDKKKGVSHLIEIENPNRVQKKTQKLSNLDDKAKGPQLSRREREELEKQQAKERYNKMHMEGKTDEARSDLARLAIIRKQREEAAKKREEERLEREAEEKAAKKS